jgi:hypothetical protein
MNYQFPINSISEKTYQLIKDHNYSIFSLTEGEFVFVNAEDYKGELFFVKRINGKYVILVDKEKKLYLYLQVQSFLYNPLTREIDMKYI